ncbi:MAG: GTP-binding protein [Clostridiales bacterium]|jgi:G3E family GTPase|nr:cobalamin biosynthesis protein P47K [Eubacteriales bacterium]MDH7565461.1 GTP-binding protein [Clostridiales bacterium]
MNIIIFSGFLGSGKTSLILSLAHYIVDHELDQEDPGKTNLLIIENEIGEIGIDDKVLKSGGYDVKELFAGCICCTLTADLTSSLNDIAEKVNPKWVIIECTGLAYPSRILDTLLKYGKGIESTRSVSVVDSERWEELHEMATILVESQVSEGNYVLINKVDLVTEEELQKVEECVKDLNPRAKQYKVTGNTGVSSDIWKEVTKLGE